MLLLSSEASWNKHEISYASFYCQQMLWSTNFHFIFYFFCPNKLILIFSCFIDPGSLRTPLNMKSKGSSNQMSNSSSNGAVNCMVSDWSQWSECSRTCGKGRRERRRLIKVEAQNGGEACPTKLVQRRKCRKNKPCCKCSLPFFTIVCTEFMFLDDLVDNLEE